MNVAVIGAGPAGLAVAGDLALRGATIALQDVDPGRITETITLGGALAGTVPVAVASTRLADVVAGAEIVIVVVPAGELGTVLAALQPAPGTRVALATGGTGAALEATALLPDVAAVAEYGALPYTCSLTGRGSVHVASVKRTLPLGVVGDPGPLLELLPGARLEPSVLHTSLANMNSVLHVVPMVLNAGWIESGARFEFYGEGISPAVAAVVGAYDAERIAVASALGVRVPTLAEWAADAYGVSGDGVHELVQNLQRDVYRALPAPATLAHRFLLEDVPFGTVPVAALGAALGVSVPVHELMVELAGRLCGTDFAAHGRGLERLGLTGRDAGGIRAAVGLTC